MEEEGVVDFPGQFSLTRIWISSPLRPRQRIQNPEQIARAMSHLQECLTEEFWIIALTSRSESLGACQVTRGVVNTSLVHAREVFRPAIVAGASAIVLIHNHPESGSGPSDDDMDTTKRMVEAGDIIGIQVLDHVIVSRYGHTSLRESFPELWDGPEGEDGSAP